MNQLKTATEVRDEVACAAKARRLALNITQEELSARSGVSMATLRRFEASGQVSFSTVLSVAEALGALGELTELFPLPKAQSFGEFMTQNKRKRASTTLKMT